MTNCDWERTANGVRCKRQGCSRTMTGPQDLELWRFRATCLALDPDLKGRAERREELRHKRKAAASRDVTKHPCVHLHERTGEQARCSGCGGKVVMNDLYACDVFGKCLPYTLDEAWHCCRICGEYEPVEE